MARQINLIHCPKVIVCMVPLLVWGVAGHCVADKTQAIMERSGDVPTLAEIDEAMLGFVERGRASGVVTLVGHQGKIVHLGAVGHADLESGRKMTPDTLFAIASMTKPITATAVMLLREEGRLDLDTPIQEHLPAFANVSLKSGRNPYRPLTLKDVMTHTSGLNGNQRFQCSLAETVDEIATRSLAFQPGEKWQYSPGLTVAGRLVELIADEPFESFLSERIFRPLGMNDTTFYPTEAQRSRLATLYQPSENSDQLVPAENDLVKALPVAGPNPSGGLVSSAKDLFAFYQMILDQGDHRGESIVDAESISLMTSPQAGDVTTGFTPGNTWGLGWCLVQEPQGATESLNKGTFGHGGAFGTQGWVDPLTETIYVLLIQRTKMGNSDASEIRRVFQKTASEMLDLR
ncbi:MAG: serine hydrolase domain-containing protein [Planctomycetota bacterium]